MLRRVALSDVGVAIVVYCYTNSTDRQKAVRQVVPGSTKGAIFDGVRWW